MALTLRRRRAGSKLRVLTASAQRVDLEDRRQARRMRIYRQGWQSAAWDYRDSIGELRYAIEFLANCASRMRLYAAALPTDGESDDPVPLKDVQGIPPEVAQLAERGLRELGHGKLALKALMQDLSSNWSVAGEAWLLGMLDSESGEDFWTVRSVDEVVIRDDKWQLREVPSDASGDVPWIDLGDNTTALVRLWAPHPRFRMLADSPLRAMMDDCEALLIQRRMIRAVSRSRLATRGILGVPDSLSLKVPIDDDSDPQADPFMEALTAAMMEPIEEEGTASAIAPIVLKGETEAINALKHIDFASTFDKEGAGVRSELIGIIATTFDLPKEVIEGMVDLNHWTAWQVDDNTFRHHVEPHVTDLVEAISAAYLRPYLRDNGVDPEVVKRCLVWYDPTELVTHPDQTKDALDLHDRLVISDEAMLRVAGFNDTDRPSKAEVQVRLLEKMRMWPPNLVMAFLHAWDPTLVAPPITTAGTIPGIKPGGVDVGEPPPTTGPPAAPVAASPPRSSATPTPPANGATPPPVRPMPQAPAQASMSARPGKAQLSRRLMLIDRDLRGRLREAANQAMLSLLERSGERVRRKLDTATRTQLSGTPRWRVTALVGSAKVEALGLTAADLTSGEWEGLRGKFYSWTKAAQEQALATAIRIGELSAEDDAVKEARDALAAGLDAGWSSLRESLTHLAQDLLYNNPPEDINPDTLVPTGVIRAACGIAGGGDVALDPGGIREISLGEPVGQIGTGSTISGLLEGAGAEQGGYEWVHGSMTQHPFEPHEALDGTQFASFEDDALTNAEGWPDNAFFLPGDHAGCGCDIQPLWIAPSEASQSESEEPPDEAA